MTVQDVQTDVQIPEELDVHEILKQSRGESMQKLVDLIPAAMADLSQQMIDNPDARIRSRLHKQMRGLFDIMQADTKNPIEQKKDTEGSIRL